MIIKNVQIYTENQTFMPGDIVIEGDRIKQIIPEAESASRQDGEMDDTIIDGHGAYAIPGLIDLHFHGCMGADVCDGTEEALQTIARYEASVGVTAIAPATMTLPVEKLEQILRNAAAYKRKQEVQKRRRVCVKTGENGEGVEVTETAEVTEAAEITEADLLGINMEGPFISPVKKGAQDEKNIIPCDVEIAKRFLTASEGLVKFIGIAPEESEQS